MNIIYKPRGAGKTTELVKMSAATGIPIVCLHPRYVLCVANDLSLDIPAPIAVKDYVPFSKEKILVDNAEHILQHLIGKIACMSISEE